MSSEVPGPNEFPTRRQGGGAGKKPEKGSRKRLKGRIWLISILVLLSLGAGAVATVWLLFEDKVRDVLGWELSNDFTGEGHGDVLVTVSSGDTGGPISHELFSKGVVKSADSFYKYLLGLEEEPVFIPGTFRLRLEMSNEAALNTLLNPENRKANTVLIIEGRSYQQTLKLLSEGTDVSLADFEAAVEDPHQYGVPAEAPSIEGYLFPATYNFEPNQTAEQMIQVMVNRTFQALDAAGVAPEDRHRVLTMAALIQREAGANKDDFYKVSRVFTNRLEAGWKLESDATVAYGSGSLDSVSTTTEQRADASNLYNTYANPGLPVGPIGGAGDLAIDAALHPVDGPWFFFVAVNLNTGKTVFSETLAEHNRAVEQWRSWCQESTENWEACQ